jgi:plastocyanin
VRAPRLLLVPVLLAACFSERSTVAPPTDARLCDGPVAEGVVVIRDFAFHPATLEVAVGEEVRWVNCDADMPHTSTGDGQLWSSGLLGANAVFSRTFEAAGTFSYFCEPHPFMRGTVVVR